MTHSPRHPQSTEADARTDWFLRNLGRFPTRDEVLAIRQHRKTESKETSA